ncbi:pyridoxal phosphate-dependent decarboxylase family protein [Micromonospora sp. DT81.3]|uniref:pyridoxal phosphate-dependent decarboxylase family protein n=1 Tax=Micromonospora sp. DT81.3 TaxID=3416523 RepID=UPI003CE89187
MDDRDRALDAAHRRATEFLHSLDERPVWPPVSIEGMLAQLDVPLDDAGMDAEAVVEDLARIADPGLAGIAGGRFYGLVIGGSLPAALAADWLVSSWDQNSGSSALTPATVALERVAGRWMLDMFGLPASASVGFVTGGQVANFTCLATARNAVLARSGWAMAERGIRSAPSVRFVVGEHRHGSIDRAARMLGIGRDEFVIVPADGEGRMSPDGLREALAQGEGPLIVCLQAGEVHTGAFDAFVSLVPIARDRGAWIHIDGAFGLWAAASPSLRHLTEGISGADSWATDAHKTLNVPYDCGMAIVRDPADSIAMFRTGGDYLVYTRLDPWDVTPELSRRARGVPAWAALRSLGRSGVAALVDRLRVNARAMADGLADIAGVEVVNDVVYTQVLFRLSDDEATRSLGSAILSDGTAVVTGAEWHGRAALRCSMSSWATTPEDIERTLAAIRRLVVDS